MKIRKLILKAKLQQIQKQYQYVFIYHCSGLTNPQWRQLKDLLYKTNSKTLFQPKRRQKQSSLHSGQPESNLALGTSACFINNKSSRLHNQGSKIALEPINSKLAFLSGPYCIFYLRSPDSLSWEDPAKATKEACSLRVNIKASSALATKMPIGLLINQSNASWSDVIKKIDSLDLKTNLVLLYAQIQATLLNHMDVQQALSLNTESVYPQFLQSTLYPVQSFNNCLNHNRNNLLSLLEEHDRRLACKHKPQSH
jgi:hypothetical protein